MARRADPDYVTGRRGRYEIQPPIVHPPFCVCDLCPRYRSTPEEWEQEFVIRARRRSPKPESRVDSATYARNFKRAEEARLRDAVRVAEDQKRARANAIRFGTLCDAYRDHMRRSGKRLDRARTFIDNVEAFFGRDRDAGTIGWDEYQELLAEVAQLAPQTQRHYASNLLAILNHAMKYRLIPTHSLVRVPRPAVVRNESPVAWTKRELAVILGPALNEYEREQAAWNAKVAAEKRKKSLRSPSVVPLRGFCFIAYFTLMRPKNNLALTWEEIDLTRGVFRLDQHKNVNRGIRAEGPIAEPLAAHLRAIRPAGASGPVHVNPETGLPYTDIRKQWARLMRIASEMLGFELQGRKAEFFTFRHTGASHLAEKTKNPILVAKMMGDTNVQTVMRHYFNLDIEFMAEMITGWSVPDIDQSSESATDEWLN